METSEIITAFLNGCGQWRGCCWPTQLGEGRLNLQGLRSSQAILMARSTAGKERADWTAATRWLEQVERDAREAQEHAELAADLAIFGQLDQACELALRACQLESQYRTPTAWQPLLDALVGRLEPSTFSGPQFPETAIESVGCLSHRC